MIPGPNKKIVRVHHVPAKQRPVPVHAALPAVLLPTPAAAVVVQRNVPPPPAVVVVKSKVFAPGFQAKTSKPAEVVHYHAAPVRHPHPHTHAPHQHSRPHGHGTPRPAQHRSKH